MYHQGGPNRLGTPSPRSTPRNRVNLDYHKGKGRPGFLSRPPLFDSSTNRNASDEAAGSTSLRVPSTRRRNRFALPGLDEDRQLVGLGSQVLELLGRWSRAGAGGRGSTLVITSPSWSPWPRRRTALLDGSHDHALETGGQAKRLGQLGGQRLDLETEGADGRLGGLGRCGLLLGLGLTFEIEDDLVGRRRDDGSGLLACRRGDRPSSYGLATSLVATLSRNDEPSWTFSPAKPMITSPCLRPALSAGLPGETSPTSTPLVDSIQAELPGQGRASVGSARCRSGHNGPCRP